MPEKKTKSIIIVVTLLLLFVMCINTVKVDAATKNFIINEYGVLEKYIGRDKIVTVPDTVKQIGAEAFKNCTDIVQINLPEGISEIGQGAFAGCSKLTGISLPESLISFESNYIEGCYALKELTFPKGVSKMQWDYTQTNGLESVNVDEQSEIFSSVEGVVFSKDGTQLLHYPQNKKDNTYQLPESVLDISLADFNRAKYLKHIIFNSNVTRTIKDNGYSDVDGSTFLNGALESFTVPEENETFGDIDGVLFTEDKREIIAYPEKRAGVSYIIPKGTKKIGSWAFSKNPDAVLNLKYLLIPDSVTEIQEGAAYVLYNQGFGRNLDISLFGKKGSVVETYANKLVDIDFALKFGYYDSSKKGEAVLINATNPIINKGGVLILASVVVPLSSNQTLTYQSSNNKVATVTLDGVIIANELGVATITAKSKNGKTVSCTVTVTLPSPTIEFDSGTSSAINLSWNKIKDAKNYTVYRKSSFDEEYIKIGTVAATSYSDTTFPKGSYCSYKVTANYKNAKYNSAKSMYVQIIIPDVPEDVRITKTDLDNSVQVNITWSPMLYSKGYVIYRSTSKNGKYTQIVMIESAYDTKFTDIQLETSKTYYYKIQAYSKYMDKYIYSEFTEVASTEVD